MPSTPAEPQILNDHLISLDTSQILRQVTFDYNNRLRFLLNTTKKGKVYCLRTLRIHNSRYETNSKLSAYTFQWLRASLEYHDWYFPEHYSLMFIEGKPGSGKSTLVKYFSDNFQADGAIMAKFFYSYWEGELDRDHRNMLQSLLYDILTADESFFIHF
ncbi:hypothetical protein BDD12DRAFT_884820 [Trichophaea hybrida]|nr:hypothetical protein BDD12DRAFT_884820 [Trichophaea hybrida]